MSDMHCQNCNYRTPSLFKQKAQNYHKNCTNIKTGDIFVCKYCKAQLEENENIRKKIIDSGSRFKLVIGGPGTGKTYLFKSIIENLPEGSEVLVITFINNLVEDLDEQLSQIPNRKIEVKTLHSFCKGFLLRNIHPYIYFPELPKIVEKDASLLELDFGKEKLSHEIANIERDGSNMRFYLSRAEYYNSASHDDAVYRVFLYLKENTGKIPKYSIVIIDEYQDFNSLEASTIKLLAQDNEIMITGDDDQALYRFKSASPEFIRDLHKDQNIEHHYLVYCRRCTAVLVKGTNAFIDSAKRKKLLENRIEKRFKCYWPEKYDDSRNNPKIVLGKCSTDSVAVKYIKKKILEIVDKEKIQPSEKEEPEFLIVGPPKIAHYIKEAYKTLVDGNDIDPNIYEIEYKKETERFTINDGYEIIKKDMRSNIGWRIVLYHDHLDPNIEKEIIRESLNGKDIVDLLPEEFTKKHKEIMENTLLEETKKPEEEKNRKIRIKLTTYLGAKGLSANHVFVLGLENGILPKNPYVISDDELCQFIVLMTRARKSLSMITRKSFNRKMKRTEDNLSYFISMIPYRLFEVRENIKAADLRNS
jgi:superfamily I DNA/RNA helicase